MTVPNDLIRQLNRQAGFDQSPKMPPASPSGQGNLRQAPIPSQVQKRQDALRQTTPIPQPATPTAKPNVPISLGQRAGGAATALSNGASRAAGALAVGTSVVNAAQNVSVRNTVNAALDIASVIAFSVPNPYAQGAAWALQGGKILYNIFTPPENTASSQSINLPFTGGQNPQSQYALKFIYIPTAGGAPVTGFSGASLFGKITNIGVGDDGNSCFIENDRGQRDERNKNQIFFGGISRILSVFIEVVDGFPPDPIDSNPNPIANNPIIDGKPNFDLQEINDKLNSLNDAISGLSFGLNSINDGIQGLRLPQANNGMPMARPAYVPKPLLNPNEKKDRDSVTSGSEDDKKQPKFKPLFNPFENGNIPSFTAKPFISGVSDPNERFNPVDEKTGLTREQFDQKILEERQKTRDNQEANRIAAKKNDDKINAQLNPQLKPQTTVQPNRTPTVNRINDPLKVNQNSPVGKPVPIVTPTGTPNPVNQSDRFKQPTDCKFSCSALADCFVDLNIEVFDGCNADNGTAETKQITIQVLPKDKARTEAAFKELLDIRSTECTLNDRVQTTADYWKTRRGQVPQAVILFKTTTKQENGRYKYYQLQIPHYNGGKKSKPSIPSYQRGEFMAIYECLDGSHIQVFAANASEAKRVINGMERYINPRMRAKDKNDIKTGKRGGLAKNSVKPIRLDFYSKGQGQSAPDWSIPLK